MSIMHCEELQQHVAMHCKWNLNSGMTAQLPSAAAPALHPNELVFKEMAGHIQAPLGAPLHWARAH